MPKDYISPNSFAQIHKKLILTEEITSKAWKSKWGWILNEYK